MLLLMFPGLLAVLIALIALGLLDSILTNLFGSRDRKKAREDQERNAADVRAVLRAKHLQLMQTALIDYDTKVRLRQLTFTDEDVADAHKAVERALSNLRYHYYALERFPEGCAPSIEIIRQYLEDNT